MQQVSTLIEKDRQMKELMKLKENEKTGMEQMTLSKSEAMDDTRGGSVRKPWASEKKGGMGQTQTGVSNVNQEKVESFEEAFAKIEAATGIHDVMLLVKNFIEAEEKNFTLFKFVNELSNEIENLEAQISEMQGEIERSKGQGMSSDNTRKVALKNLEEKLSRTEMKAE